MSDIIQPLQPGLCQPCPDDCSNPFDRVVVSYLTAGGTRVLWDLKNTFVDPRPYTFQLQVGQSANPEADDWEDVGAPVTDIFYAVDGQQRIFGKLRWQFYRVLLTTPTGTYASQPTGLMGILDHRQWRLASEQVRMEMVYMRNGDGQQGYLLKRRVAGQRCRNCTDYQTGEIKQPYCPYCFGTGFECGYFYPIGCVWAQFTTRRYRINNQGNRGTVADIAVKARMLATWLLSEDDVFVDKQSDDRWYIHDVEHLTEYRGVPVAADVVLRLAPSTDPVYALEIPDQVESLERMGVRV